MLLSRTALQSLTGMATLCEGRIKWYGSGAQNARAQDEASGQGAAGEICRRNCPSDLVSHSRVFCEAVSTFL